MKRNYVSIFPNISNFSNGTYLEDLILFTLPQNPSLLRFIQTQCPTCKFLSITCIYPKCIFLIISMNFYAFNASLEVVSPTSRYLCIVYNGDGANFKRSLTSGQVDIYIIPILCVNQIFVPSVWMFFIITSQKTNQIPVHYIYFPIRLQVKFI